MRGLHPNSAFQPWSDLAFQPWLDHGAPCVVGSLYAFVPEAAFFGEGASSFVPSAV